MTSYRRSAAKEGFPVRYSADIVVDEAAKRAEGFSA